MFFKIYDAQILPVLRYGSEIWGYHRFDAIEKAHLFACKRLLNVGFQTPNAMVLGDLARFPIFILTAVRCIKFWLRILRLPEERLTKKAYNMLIHLQENGKKTWTFHVMQLICTNGFGEVWFQQGVGDGVHSSDVSGRDWLISIHKVGLQISRPKKDLSFIPALNVFFRVKNT